MKLLRQRKPNRMPRYDYNSRGCYFVTICIKNTEMNLFGKLVKNNVTLSPAGETVKKCWLEIPLHFPGIKLDEFVVMPNHIHGILVILGHAGNANMRSLHSGISSNQNVLNKSVNTPTDRTKMVVSKVIQCFKAAVTREINEHSDSDFFVWQKSFYDHIIHDYKELLQIRLYIKENPKKWPKEDEDFVKVLTNLLIII